MKKKGYAKGGGMMKKKGYARGGAKMPMAKDPKTGKMVPTYAMDGKGKMRAGGTMKKKGYAKGGMQKVITAKAGRTIGKTADARRTMDKAIKGAKLKLTKQEPAIRNLLKDMKSVFGSLKNDSRMSDQDIKTISRILNKTKNK